MKIKSKEETYDYTGFDRYFEERTETVAMEH